MGASSVGRAGPWLKVSVTAWSRGSARDVAEGDPCVLALRFVVSYGHLLRAYFK